MPFLSNHSGYGKYINPCFDLFYYFICHSHSPDQGYTAYATAHTQQIVEIKMLHEVNLCTSISV